MKNQLPLHLIALSALFVGGLRQTFCTANAESTTGTHTKAFTCLADAAHSYRHLLVKVGSDADHIALCGASNLPSGLTDDQPAAAEDAINVKLLGASNETVRMTCATALTGEIDLYTAANGFVQAEPETAGTYYKVGRSKSAAALISTGLYTIEVEPCQPDKLVVLAALTSSNGTAAGAADLAALKTEAEKIGDDVRAIGTALATPARLKVLAA